MFTSSRHRDDRPVSTGWVLPVSTLTLSLIVLGSSMVALDLFRDEERPNHPTVAIGAALQASPTATPSPQATVTPTKATTSELISAAMKVKPLEDIETGDRVIYQGHVCFWLLWNKNINTSTIRCRHQRAFQIQTGRLTPVELKDGPSRLTVRHPS